MVRVKICGLTRTQDVIDAVKAGADALGFVFTDRSKRVIGSAEAEKLVREVPAFVSRVGLFMDQEAATIRAVLERVPLSLLQFHGREAPGFCRQFGLPYVKALSLGDGRVLNRAEQDYADAAGLLLDSHAPGGPGGTGEVFDWSEIPDIRLPLILAGGLTPENVGQAVRRVKPWAVDVSSGVEEAPGLKSAAKMQAFINEAKREY
jgi:phosphoribosylanthranilate isomerase